MQGKKHNNRILSFLIPMLAIIAVMISTGALISNRMEEYIKSSGETTMSGVMEQMAQVYDLQVSSVYERLERVERILFAGEDRSFSLDEQKDFLAAMTDNSSEKILFIRDNGLVLTADNDVCYTDIQTSSLLKLKQNQNIAQSINWNAANHEENYFLVAIPCEPFTVNDTQFSALGIVYDRSGFDNLLEVNGFDGAATLFAVDENGIAAYTNLDGDEYVRNYAVLRHMKSDKDITDAQFDSLSAQLSAGETGLETICYNGEDCYLGFRPLETTDNRLLCIVPTSVLNGSLIEYQSLVSHLIVLVIVLFTILSLALMLYISKAEAATKRAEFEEETRRIKEDAMAALEIERDRADYANQAKSEFLSNMSHDIRTPMNAIVGFTSLAIAHIDDDKSVLRDYLEKISVSSEHLLSLINDVLDMSRIESGKIQIQESESSMAAMAHGLRSILQSSVSSKNIDFFIDTVDIEHELVYCDKLRVNQVLINIASNAVKYTPLGGAVHIKFTELPGAPEGYADFEFSVADTGIGMSEEFQKTVFEPFTREANSTVSRIEGTGLGMAITKNIVDMMGGTISVTSKLGVGSEFVVKLRFKTIDNNEPLTVIPELDGCRALVADDNMDTCGSVAKMLRSAGLRAEWTTLGKEVVFRTKMATEENDPFKVYIIDWQMPDMNGIEVVRRVRNEIGDEVPIIILTAYDWHNIEKEAREAGVTAFCSKPLFRSELLCALRSAENGSGSNKVTNAPAMQFKGKRILVVDDVDLNREIATAVINDAGILVETAENGQVAVEMVSKSKDGYYDLVLMDVMMPVMDGYQATMEIRKLNNRALADIPIIAMTANAFEEDRLAALKAGMNDHLAKPIQIEKLYEMMKKYL